MNGFKTMFSAKLVTLISDWLDHKFMVICRADAMHLIRRFSNSKKKSVYAEKTLNEARLCSIFKGTAVPAELFESYGTIRFVNMFPLVLYVLMNGETLVMDEFDVSIQSMALMNIINIFHNDEINVHHAQLIFNTHNPVFLNASLYRRDEIKFVERNDDMHCSTLTSLTDTARLKTLILHLILRNCCLAEKGCSLCVMKEPGS